MPSLPVAYSRIVRATKEWHSALDAGFPPEVSTGRRSALMAAGVTLGIPSGTAVREMTKHLDTAEALGLNPRMWREIEDTYREFTQKRYLTYDTEFQAVARRTARPGRSTVGGPKLSSLGGLVSPADRAPPKTSPTVVVATPEPEPTSADQVARVVPLLRHGPMTVDELAAKLKTTAQIADLLVQLAHAGGAALTKRGNKWYLDAGAPPAGSQKDHAFQLVTDKDGFIEFAGCADNHSSSKYSRADCLELYFDEIAKRGITTVLHGGNWIDGEARFNMHDLETHGMDQQMQRLAKEWPKRDGVATWAICGEDHEGWYARREGIDVGRYCENTMRQNGREDWFDLGFMECFIPLVNAASGKSSQLCLMHPGGGSAYALSYAPQKIVEGFDGGAKPAVLLIGHYHKASYQMTRNVHVAQLGCFQDQSLFMRQKKLAAHLGGWIFKLHVDPRTGAVDQFTSTFFNFFVKDFYEGRWSEHGPVKNPTRSMTP